MFKQFTGPISMALASAIPLIMQLLQLSRPTRRRRRRHVVSRGSIGVRGDKLLGSS